MRLIPFSLLLLVISVCSCAKNDSGTSGLTSYLSVSNVSGTRDTVNSTISFVISVENPNKNPISFNYATEEGTAKANVDFTPVSGSKTIAANATQVTVDVPVIGRRAAQGAQQFYLVITNPSNAVIKFDRGTASIQNPGFGYSLVWAEDFNGSTLNTNDWNYETGAGGWGNNELQNYTSGTNNAYIENGSLVIEAKQENLGGSNYTSARLTTKRKKKFTYGKIEFRAKVPSTKGLWPALWMLGSNIDAVPWPACGEIDVMESVNKEVPSKIYGTAHWGTATTNHQQSGNNFALSTGDFSQDYHVFSIEWDANKIQWLMDGNKYHELNKSQVTVGTYPFDKDFFLILDVAVGGQWPGNPDATSIFPQKMYVDYIHVYQK